VAVTGFSEKDIEISLEGGLLSIKGSKDSNEAKDAPERTYHTKNIAKRSFIRQFNLADSIIDVEAKISNGLLHLKLIEKEKENSKKLIPIGS
jgi:HSP20 family molecular chaperone IbpA